MGDDALERVVRVLFPRNLVSRETAAMGSVRWREDLAPGVRRALSDQAHELPRRCAAAPPSADHSPCRPADPLPVDRTTLPVEREQIAGPTTRCPRFAPLDRSPGAAGWKVSRQR